MAIVDMRRKCMYSVLNNPYRQKLLVRLAMMSNRDAVRPAHRNVCLLRKRILNKLRRLELNGATRWFESEQGGRAVITTKHPCTALQSMANDAHAAVRASGSQCPKSRTRSCQTYALAVKHDLKRFFVVISAGVACGHGSLQNQWSDVVPFCIKARVDGGRYGALLYRSNAEFA